MGTWATIGLLLALPAVVYGILIMIFTRGWYRRKAIPGRTFNEPRHKVSIIIAARNEERDILAILGDLSRQSYPAELMEVIVADDGSADGTARVVEDFIAGYPGLSFRLLRVGVAGNPGSKKRALSQAIGEATGNIILVTDADCRVGRNWTSELVRYFEDEKIAMVSGPVAINAGKSCFKRFQSMEFLGLVASGAGAVKSGLPFICNGANLSYRKDVFMEVKGFEGNEGYLSGDDVFLMHKIKKLKGSQSICFAQHKEALVRTQPAPGLTAFFRQRARWASKSPGYRDKTALVVAVSVLLNSLAILSAFCLGFYAPEYFLVYAVLLVFKTIIDLPLIIGIVRFTGSKGLVWWLPLFEIGYPFYILLAGAMSLAGRRKW